jgi:hypothetical protein
MGIFGLPQLRYHSPWTQNLISGVGVGASAGIYIALNLLGAGGGRPDSAQVVQVVNATLCAVWFFSSSFGGSILNKLGPGLTMCLGVQTYAVYVGSLWYYDETGKKGYPFAAGPIIGIGAGMVFITAGYVATGYPEEREKGSYATVLMNMQALGSVISGIIPVIINRNSETVAGVPRSVYISFIVIMVCGGLFTLLLQRPQKLTRDDGSVVAVHPPRGAWEELKSNLLIFTDPILLMMVPAFLPSEGFLVYSGSVNGKSIFLPSSYNRADSSQHTTTTCERDLSYLSSQSFCRYLLDGAFRQFLTIQAGVAGNAVWLASRVLQFR